MKKEVCLMCIVCFFLGYFVADVVSKCGFGREHYAAQDLYLTGADVGSGRHNKRLKADVGGVIQAERKY